MSVVGGVLLPSVIGIATYSLQNCIYLAMKLRLLMGLGGGYSSWDSVKNRCNRRDKQKRQKEYRGEVQRKKWYDYNSTRIV